MADIGATARRKKKVTDIDPVEPPTMEAAAKAIDGPSNDSQGVGGVGPDHLFALDYTDSRGHVWRGEFRCRALTIRDRVQVGLTRARLAGGLSPAVLDGDTLDLLEMQAHLAVVLEEGPDWAEKLSDFHDVGLIAAIYKEVSEHEARFWGATR